MFEGEALRHVTATGIPGNVNALGVNREPALDFLDDSAEITRIINVWTGETSTSIPVPKPPHRSIHGSARVARRNPLSAKG
jgi:hypothetical protein